VFVVTAVAASAASASTCPETGVVSLCIELAPAAEGSYKFSGKNKAESNLSVASLGLSIDSPAGDATATGEFVQGKVLTTALTVKDVVFVFTGLVVLTPANCTASNVTTNATSGTFSDPIATVTLTPESPATTFANVVIAGASCPATIKGTHAVSGSQLVNLIKPETDLKIHEVEAVTKSSLLYAEKEANLTLLGELSLTSGKEFTVELA
jgi:hypothetical protein